MRNVIVSSVWLKRDVFIVVLGGGCGGGAHRGRPGKLEGDARQKRVGLRCIKVLLGFARLGRWTD